MKINSFKLLKEVIYSDGVRYGIYSHRHSFVCYWLLTLNVFTSPGYVYVF